MSPSVLATCRSFLHDCFAYLRALFFCPEQVITKAVLWLIKVPLIAIYLSGCGNMVQTTSAGKWQDVQTSDKPAPSEWEYETSRLREGSGSQVKRHDLVKIGMRVIAGSYLNTVVNQRDTHEMWVYAGAAVGEQTGVNERPFQFSLGSAALRNALVGRRVGERFLAIERAQRGSSFAEKIPAKALIFELEITPPFSMAVPKWKNRLDGRLEGHLSFIELMSSDKRRGHITFDVEVLDTCPAKLFKKDGTMLQIGHMSGSWWHGDGGRPSSNSRDGLLQWGAVEAKCDKSEEKPIRIEAGPIIYRSSLRDHLGTYPIEIPATDALYEADGYGLGRKWLQSSGTSKPIVRDLNNGEEKISDEIAGTIWSMDNGISDEKECKGRSIEFIDACKTHVRLNSASSRIPAITPPIPDGGKASLFGESRVLANVRGWVRELTFSPDSKVLMSRIDRNVILWDVETGRARRLWNDSANVNYVAFSADSRQIAWGSWGNTGLLDLRGAQDLRDLHSKEIVWLAFTSNDKSLMTVNANSMVSLWNVGDGSKLADLLKESQIGVPNTHRESASGRIAVALSSDNNVLAIGSPDQSIRLWNIVTGELMHTMKLDSKAISLAFSPDGNRLASGGADLRLWDVKTGIGEVLLPGIYQSEFNKVSFSPDGRMLAVDKADRTIGIWDVARRTELDVISTPGVRTYSNFAFSPNGKLFAAAQLTPDTGTIRIWTLPSSTDWRDGLRGPLEIDVPTDRRH